MAHDNHLHILQKGAENWNSWRIQNPDIQPDLSGADLRNLDLRKINLFKTNLAGSNLHGTNLEDAVLNESDLSGAKLQNTKLENASLIKVSMSDLTVEKGSFKNTNLTGSYLSRSVFTNTDLSGANLSGADLRETRFLGVQLADTIFKGAKFIHTIFKDKEGNLIENIEGLQLVGNSAEIEKIDKDLVQWNKSRKEEDLNLYHLDFSGKRLSGINFKKASLWNSNFTNADLKNASLNEADLFMANLRGADLTGADLSSANLANADLSGADLSSANLSGADLRNANLSFTRLRTADLSDAKLQGVVLENTDFSGATMLGATLDDSVSWQSAKFSYNAEHLGKLREGAEVWNAWRASKEINEKGESVKFVPVLRGANLRDANLKGANLSNAELWYANLQETKLNGAKLNNANLKEADLRMADLRLNFELKKEAKEKIRQKLSSKNEILDQVEILLETIKDDKFLRQELEDGKKRLGLQLVDIDKIISYAVQRRSDLSGANLTKADLRGAFIDGTTQITKSIFKGAVLSAQAKAFFDWGEAIFTGRQDHYERLQQGVDGWNSWRKEYPTIIPVLRGFKLKRLDLRGADLSYADLWNADLFGAKLSGANLHGAYLRNSDLREAMLNGADLSGANLKKTDMSKADLRPQYKIRFEDLDKKMKDKFPSEVILKGEIYFIKKEDLAEYSLSERDLAELWKNAQRTRTNLSNAWLNESKLSHANFSDANISRADLNKADLSAANLKGVKLSGVNLSEADLSNAILRKADLRGAVLADTSLDGADLSGADLSDLELKGVDLSKSNHAGAILPNKNIKEEILKESYYNPDHLAELAKGAETWNKWREDNRNTIPVLRNIVLTGKYIKTFVVTDASLKSMETAGVNEELIRKCKPLRNQEIYGNERFLIKGEIDDTEFQQIKEHIEIKRAAFNLCDYDLSGADLRGAILERVDLTGANLRYANLEKANLNFARLNFTRLRLANLSDTRMESVELFGARIIEADLSGANMSEANTAEPPKLAVNIDLNERLRKRGRFGKRKLEVKNNHSSVYKTIFLGSKLVKTKLIGANLEEADLSETRLNNADLSFANLNNANFKNADLTNANLINANLDGAAFAGAKLSTANFSFIQDQVERLAEGAKKWNAWRKANPELKPILRDADLNDKELRNYNLSNADLRETNLSGADLRDADLHGADLGGAMLRKAYLRRADLRGVNLKAANLREADLGEAKLSGADLTKADLNRADLSNADLRSSESVSGIAAKGSAENGSANNDSGEQEKRTILRETDLREADLYGANLYRADLSKSNLTQANLSRVNLREADLNNSDLRRANLSGANLREANLKDANLSGANLIGAQYSEEQLKSDDEKGEDYSKYDWIRNLMDEMKEGNIIIRNRTARKIEIKEDYIVLPPFGERKITLNEYQKYSKEINDWKESSLITLDVNTLDPDQQIRFSQSSKFAAKSLIGKFINLLRWIFAFLGAKTVLFFKWFPGFLYIQLTNFLSFLPVLIIGIGMPASIIYFFGGLQDLFGGGSSILSLPVLARALQFLFIVITALLPVLLYYLFDRQQLGTLRENFYRNVLELDTKIMTLDDAKSIYGVRVAEVYGQDSAPNGQQKLGQQVTRLPMLVATLVITIGWILTLKPFGPIPETFDVKELYKFLTPSANPISYGFLGAYFYSINMIIRRYTRADLKPKTYSHITVRFLIVMILVWVITLLPRFGDGVDDPRSVLMILAFFIGIVPETALTIIREFLQKSFGKAIPSLNEKMPLTSLDGVTIYERARLEEEGIENIENLVYYDLIDLMLQTRIPLSRLIDWVDQGLLHLHLYNELSSSSSKADADNVSYLSILRLYGIRNASDLIEVYQRAEERDRSSGQGKSNINFDRFMKLLPSPEKEGPLPMETIYDALQNDEWLGNILRWRSRNSLPGERAYKLKEMHLSYDELKGDISFNGNSDDHAAEPVRKAEDKIIPLAKSKTTKS